MKRGNRPRRHSPTHDSFLGVELVVVLLLPLSYSGQNWFSTKGSHFCFSRAG
ncbi:unnamed protein product [Rhodiola kirilowii]